MRAAAQVQKAVGELVPGIKAARGLDTKADGYTTVNHFQAIGKASSPVAALTQQLCQMCGFGAVHAEPATGFEAPKVDGTEAQPDVSKFASVPEGAFDADAHLKAIGHIADATDALHGQLGKIVSADD